MMLNYPDLKYTVPNNEPEEPCAVCGELMKHGELVYRHEQSNDSFQHLRCREDLKLLFSLAVPYSRK